MQTVCELRSFMRAADAAGMSESERRLLIDYLAANPAAGDEIQGTGGCRKLRVAGRNKGKSGGFRVITFYSGSAMPVFLITVFSKGERANLSKAECNELATMTQRIADEYRTRVVKTGTRS
jgi:hypothetical protein